MKHLNIILKSGQGISYLNLGPQVIHDLLEDLKGCRDDSVDFWLIYDADDRCIANFDVADISTAYAFSS